MSVSQGKAQKFCGFTVSVKGKGRGKKRVKCDGDGDGDGERRNQSVGRAAVNALAHFH